nr:gasdermin-C-like [Peromyscus maniculatus bairdii]
MPHSFDWVCKDIVKKLQGKDLKPVGRLSDAMKFRQFEILQKNPQSLFFEYEDTPVGSSLLQILEPNCPVPGIPEVSTPIPLKHTVSWKLKANMGVAEGSVSAELVQSCGYDIEVWCTSIPDSKLESPQNRKLLDWEPSFVKDCQMGMKDLYVVTEAFEVTKDAVLEDSSSVDLSGKVGIPQVVKV